MAPGSSPAGPLTTRQAQRESTRARVLDAAVDALFELGYSGASTLEIQRRAGLSRGGLLHQFASRDELLVAAVHHLASVRVAALTDERSWPSTPEERVDAAVEAMWLQYRQPYFWVSVELWLAARHNRAVRNALGPLERDLGASVRASTAAFFGEDLVGKPGYAPLREMLMTSMRGVGLAYAVSPDRNPDTDPHLGFWQQIARHYLLDESW
ncbi:MAG: TetR family transcriptional regulator [Marmoricola sp.]|nr:TetR family transcriptional regulator [Marmoricola sp.]